MSWLATAPHAVRFAYDGAAEHEHATLHGLAAAYEGYFLLTARPINGHPTYQHHEREDKWIAFNGKAWMGQNESMLGTATGVLQLRDACDHPDLSRETWLVTPGWKPLPGLRCLAMTEEDVARWQAAGGGHLELLVQVARRGQESAGLGFLRRQGRPAFTTLEQEGDVVEPQARLLLGGAVALVASTALA